MKQLEELGVETIDMVVINLYPFKQTIMKDGVQLEEAIENIDIGGSTMLRAAAKNYQDVAVVVDPADYSKCSKRSKRPAMYPGDQVQAGLQSIRTHQPLRHADRGYLRSKLGDESSPKRCR